LASGLRSFLAENSRAVLMEDGRVLFDLARAQYRISSDHGRCVLQVWSEDSNLVRTVAALHPRKDSLKIEVRRFGQSRPQCLHLIANRNVRIASSRAATRTRYVRLLERLLPRRFEPWRLESLTAALDLEHSFGPAYARGLMTRGQRAWAVLGVSGDELPATVDGALALGILWLDLCRKRAGPRRLVEGLRLILPAGAAELARTRLAWLDPSLAKWELYELDQASEELFAVEAGRDGNLAMHLPLAFSAEAALSRVAPAVDRILATVPEACRSEVDIRARSATEAAVFRHGLEFARVRHGTVPGTFARREQITFGAGAQQMELTAESAPLLGELVARLFASRHPDGDARDPLFRMQPERWMESRLRANLGEIEPTLGSGAVYQQLPAFAAGDRGMLDLLTTDVNGRLVVLELKAEEDLHMPLQGLDYWIRVHRLHGERSASEGRGPFEKAGYFPGQTLSPLAPLLYFVAPALRIHPATETILRYFSPEIDWTLLAINEGWRSGPKTIWRKRRPAARAGEDHPVAASGPQQVCLRVVGGQRA
jgi:hypothetical protein